MSAAELPSGAAPCRAFLLRFIAPRQVAFNRGMACATQPGHGIWKAQATTTRPRCASRSTGAEVFSHAEVP